MPQSTVREPEPSPTSAANAPVSVSFVIEWANTTYNGVPRFFGLLDILTRQWAELMSGMRPPSLSSSALGLLERIAPVPEVILVSGERIEPTMVAEIRKRCADVFDLRVQVSEGLEYYALKNFGGGLASRDLICFLDSDVHPDAGWLAHLLGSFGREDVAAVAGQPYVAPVDLMSRAFALGWTYELADHSGRMFQSEKFYANNLAFRAPIFRLAQFPELNRRTRGAGTLLGARLRDMGYAVWQNRSARVDHPAPSSLRHLIVRALAHGRDIYMKDGERRSLAGLKRSQATAGQRFARGVSNTFRYRRRVDLDRMQVPGALAIIAIYYGFFSLGGLLTHLSPEGIGSRFRL
jgi:hypothetical protein